MAKRNEHLFSFKASTIAWAAIEQAAHHEARLEFWTKEKARCVKILKERCSCEVREIEVSGGTRCDVVINYGDMGAYRRIGECEQKIQKHREDAERYRSDHAVYATQGDRVYELDLLDVHHYKLDGKKAED